MPLRQRLTELLRQVTPADEWERRHLAAAQEWISSGAPLDRAGSAEMHLVSYFVVLDEAAGQLLLVAHRKSGLWLPAGGHLEQGEDPWDAVVRECREELHIEAVPSAVSGTRPLFVTITRTRADRPGQHTDVSLWFVLRAAADEIQTFDKREFTGIRWLPVRRVLEEPIESLDPHMHRFTRKLMAAAGV